MLAKVLVVFPNGPDIEVQGTTVRIGNVKDRRVLVVSNAVSDNEIFTARTLTFDLGADATVIMAEYGEESHLTLNGQMMIEE